MKTRTYFACDTPQMRALCQQIETALAKTTDGAGAWFALVDTAFDHDGPPLTWPSAHARIYAHDRLAALAEVSPLLCELRTAHAPTLQREVLRLVSHTAGRPMLGFVQSRLPADDLARALADVAAVSTADGQPFLLRWADTRVAEYLPQALTAAHWARVTRAVQQWWIVDRRGELVLLALADPAQPIADADKPIQLTDDELSHLIAAGEPDALTQVLSEHFSDLLPKEGRAELHRTLQRLCALARRCGVERFARLQSLAVAVLGTRGALLDDPKFEPWLQLHAHDEHGFEDALAPWVESAEEQPA